MLETMNMLGMAPQRAQTRIVQPRISPLDYSRLDMDKEDLEVSAFHDCIIMSTVFKFTNNLDNLFIGCGFI